MKRSYRYFVNSQPSFVSRFRLPEPAFEIYLLRMDSHAIDNDLLIAEIKKRPSLYDRNAPDYNDVVFKRQLWVDVCKSVFENWNNFSSSEKNERVKHAQKKWRNLRDYFTKKIRKTGLTEGKNKLKYIYFHQLSFLLPTIEYFDSINNLPTPSDSNDAAESKSDEVSDDEVIVTEDFPIRPNKKKKTDTTYEERLLDILQEKRNGVATEGFPIRLKTEKDQDAPSEEPPLEVLQQKRHERVATKDLPATPKSKKTQDATHEKPQLETLPQKRKEVAAEDFPTRPKKKRKQDTTYEERLLDILRQKKQEDSVIDEDKLFLMSLVPTFKKLNDEQKFVARMEIMQTLRRVRFPASNALQLTHNYGPPELSTSHPIGSSSDAVKTPSAGSNTDINVEPHSTFIFKSEVLSPVEEEDTVSDVSSILS